MQFLAHWESPIRRKLNMYLATLKLKTT
uniref:Uncharacterized protein n=1 Tax=Moniliophthora roreri TaxID=221103 RepID=A0A0W0FMZ8_MONRR